MKRRAVDRQRKPKKSSNTKSALKKMAYNKGVLSAHYIKYVNVFFHHRFTFAWPREERIYQNDKYENFAGRKAKREKGLHALRGRTNDFNLKSQQAHTHTHTTGQWKWSHHCWSYEITLLAFHIIFSSVFLSLFHSSSSNTKTH